jgi:hypothetical protein
MKAIFLALLLSAGLLSSAAMAQTVMQACGPDVQRSPNRFCLPAARYRSCRIRVVRSDRQLCRL